ncbi:MAG: NAD(P)H-binding protein [Bryobacterales bacterium]|nr:NAD(P)H-binding protein [Bryobacterales bacterium]
MNMTLIIGSSSNAGRPLVEALSVSGERIRCATRNPAQYKAPANGEAVRFDYQDPATYEAALEGTNRVFGIAPPAADPAGVVIPFLQQAARNGRKIVLMTAMGTEFEENGPLRRVEIALEKSGAPFVILRPNWFMDNFHGMWLPAIRHAGVIAVPASDSLTSFIDARDIAACAASALATDRARDRGASHTRQRPGGARFIARLGYSDAFESRQGEEIPCITRSRRTRL